MNWETNEEKEQGSLDPSLTMQVEARFGAEGEVEVAHGNQVLQENDPNMDPDPSRVNYNFFNICFEGINYYWGNILRYLDCFNVLS